MFDISGKLHDVSGLTNEYSFIAIKRVLNQMYVVIFLYPFICLVWATCKEYISRLVRAFENITNHSFHCMLESFTDCESGMSYQMVGFRL